MSDLVLVNGAAGFLGRHVVEFLRQKGYRVRATDKPGTNLDHLAEPGVETVYQDLLDPAGIPRLFEGVGAAVNVAGYFSLSADYDTLFAANVTCTENFCEAASKFKLERLVHISSIGVYGLPVRYRIKEHELKRPRNDYERTKKLGEDTAVHYHDEKGLPVTVLRPALIYGPAARYGQAPIIAAMAALKYAGLSRIYLYDGGPEMHHVHVGDVACAVEILLRSDKSVGEAFNCGDKTPIDWGTWLQWIAAEFGLKYGKIPWHDLSAALIFGLLVRMPRRPVEYLNQRLRRIWSSAIEKGLVEDRLRPGIDPGFLPYLSGHHTYDTGKIESLGFEARFPYTRDGLIDTIQWYRENRWLV